MQYQQNSTCCQPNYPVTGWSYGPCGNPYPVVPGSNPALQIWNGQNFVVADGSYQNPISLPFLKINQNPATYFVGSDNNGNWSYYNPTNMLNGNNIQVTATGSTTARTLANRFADVVNVLDYGADPTGVNDSTDAIQNAINQAEIANGKTVYFPAGVYIVSATINITNSVHLTGDGRTGYGSSATGSIIQWSSKTLGVFNVTTANNITVTNLTFSGPSNPTDGYVFQLGTNSAINAFSTFKDLTFNNSYIAIKTISSETISIYTCYFYGHVVAGVLINDIANADAGDSTIIDCLFNTSVSSSCGALRTRRACSRRAAWCTASFP